MLTKSNRQDGYTDPIPDTVVRSGVSVIILALALLMFVGCATEQSVQPIPTDDEVTVSEKAYRDKGMSPIADTLDKPLDR